MASSNDASCTPTVTLISSGLRLANGTSMPARPKASKRRPDSSGRSGRARPTVETSARSFTTSRLSGPASRSMAATSGYKHSLTASASNSSVHDPSPVETRSTSTRKRSTTASTRQSADETGTERACVVRTATKPRRPVTPAIWRLSASSAALMTVPASSGRFVFLITSGMPASFTGNTASSCRTLAPM